MLTRREPACGCNGGYCCSWPDPTFGPDDPPLNLTQLKLPVITGVAEPWPDLLQALSDESIKAPVEKGIFR